MTIDAIAFHAEVEARRVERAAAQKLREYLQAEATKSPVDAAAVRHAVVAHLDAKRMRLSDNDFAEFEVWGEFEELAAELFLRPFHALTWSMAKEIAMELAR